MFRYQIGLIGVLVTGCATTPGQIHRLADADDPRDQAEATRAAVEWLSDRSAPEALRMSAVRALGRLRASDPRAVNALTAVLDSAHESRDLRCMAAWSLGELRDPEALKALSGALRQRLRTPLDRYVLEGLAKHTALMANDEETLVSVVERLVFYAGNLRGEPPPIYAVLSQQTRTAEVNVEVLQRAVQERQTDGGSAALYNAALELLLRLDRRQSEISAGPSTWAPRIDASVDVAGRAYAAKDLRTQLLVLYFLGRLAQTPEVASRIARDAQSLQLNDPGQPALRLLAVWLLDRLQLTALGPRKMLAVDVLTRLQHPEVLRLIADLGRSPARSVGPDAPQRWLGVEVRPQ